MAILTYTMQGYLDSTDYDVDSVRDVLDILFNEFECNLSVVRELWLNGECELHKENSNVAVSKEHTLFALVLRDNGNEYEYGEYITLSDLSHYSQVW